MGDMMIEPTAVPPDIVERETLCLSTPKAGMVVHRGDVGFKEELARLYSLAESNAAEKLVKLKDLLRNADVESFWPALTEGLAEIADAQYAFVSKRILVDDHNQAVEMPPIGEPGSCLMGAAFYVNDGHGTKHQLTNFKYHAYSCPCAHMKHDKVFVIPDRLNDFIVNNPNELAIPGEAYLGIPLFADGKCFAHFGVMWSHEGAARRQLGWGYLEMLFHSLEDMILARVLQGDSPARSAERIHDSQPRIVPHEAITVAQSLKPYARSLSHELRTPLQGVVGMLDVMMANVKEASEGLEDSRIRRVLDTLKANIESVQDSSRRAVEAADNVVHAYDMNMGVPETPLSPLDKDPANLNVFLRDRHPDILVSGQNIPITQYRGIKRRREGVAWASGNTPHVQPRVSRAVRRRVRHSLSEEPAPTSMSRVFGKHTNKLDTLESTPSPRTPQPNLYHESSASPHHAFEYSVAPGLRNTTLREVIQTVITDALKVGGRPDSAIAQETDLGEIIEVRTRSSSGQAKTKMIEWMLYPEVPETIFIDQRDLAKMISCVILNAIKFTDSGSITLKASLSAHARYVVINIKDSGSGIPAAFLPNLFKPFSREDDSTTRSSEGLGLGLLVAKGLARKLGGDLFCVRSNVSGPEKGSEFEMRVPLAPGDVCSRPASPFGSPTPSDRPHLSSSVDVPSFFDTQPATTPPLTFGQLRNEQNISARDGLVDTRDRLKVAPSLQHLSPLRSISPVRHRSTSKSRRISDNGLFDRGLARKHPLNFLVVEDNKINRKLLVSMLQKLGYTEISEAYDGNNAVEQMRKERPGKPIDIILMDLWMPLLDGFQAAETILKMEWHTKPTILAVSADITDGALERAAKVGMKGFLTKPFQIRDLEKLIVQYCASRTA